MDILYLLRLTAQFFITGIFLVAVYKSAKNRGRNAIVWTLISLSVIPFIVTNVIKDSVHFTSLLASTSFPFLILFILHILGETKGRRKERIIEEMLLREKFRNGTELDESLITSDNEIIIDVPVHK